MHHDTFNADFYVAAATVIPVLFLALTLQGQTYESLATRSLTNRYKKGRKSQSIASVLFIAAEIIVFSGAAGEFLAIWSVYNRSSIFGSSIAILWFVMAIAVVMAPIWKFADMIRDARKGAYK